MYINGLVNPNIGKIGFKQQLPQDINVPAGASGVNINIINPTAGGSTPACYNTWAMGGYNVGDVNRMAPSNPPSNPPTPPNDAPDLNNDPNYKQKRITVINDEYIKTLEQWLNSQDLSERKIAAKHILARLQEDKRRYDNPALNALVTKMLQDPNQDIRSIALLTLNTKLARGNEYTQGILRNLTESTACFGLEGKQAREALMNMSESSKLINQRISKD